MTTLLIVGHGSREPSGNAEIEQFVAQWREQYPQWHTELCFIELADVLIPEGLDKAAEHAKQNDGKVLVLPLILNAAGHVKKDIPYALYAAHTRHPNVSFSYAHNLYVCDPILKILRRQLRAAMLQLDMPDQQNTGVILLGRGSKDRHANGDLAKMARWLFELNDYQSVDLAFTGVSYPRLEGMAQRQIQLGARQVVVLPYYLFTGVLFKRIERQVENLKQQYPHVRFAHSRYIGFEKEIYELLAQRVHGWQNGDASVILSSDSNQFGLTEAEVQDAAHHQHHHHHHDHDDSGEIRRCCGCGRHE